MNRGSRIDCSGFWSLERLGQIRLSRHFFLRQFLYSEIAAHFSVPNIPTDIDLAIEVGRELCVKILEPIVSEFGAIVVRSGYRSSVVNALGASRGLKCASNQKNAAVHIWDQLDTSGSKGAAACIVVPRFIDEGWRWEEVAEWLYQHLPFHKVVFFRNNMAFNIGWHEKPSKEVYSYLEPRGAWGPNVAFRHQTRRFPMHSDESLTSEGTFTC